MIDGMKDKILMVSGLKIRSEQPTITWKVGNHGELIFSMATHGLDISFDDAVMALIGDRK